MKEKNSGTVDAQEIERFARMASEWWDPEGKFKPLHRMNPLRIRYIADHVPPLKGAQLLDIGCGGGLVCEPLARLGANVTGIDAGDKNIDIAKLHAAQSGLEIDYRCMAAEELAATGAQFDIVLALEIVEHVADVAAFVEAAGALVRPGGTIIFSTLNRTPKAFALAVLGAEYILRWLPIGTHHFHKFLRPSELCKHLRHNTIEVTDMTGMVMHPLTGQWRLNAKDLSVNYVVAGRKSLS